MSSLKSFGWLLNMCFCSGICVGHEGLFIKGTTIEHTYLPMGEVFSGEVEDYRKIIRYDGWPLVIREDLYKANPSRLKGQRNVLCTFGHLTDMHLIDPQSPARLAYVHKYCGDIDYSSAFRPHETLSYHVGEAMVRQLNGVKGPVSRNRMQLFVVTGDSTDNCQYNEIKNFVSLLDGKDIDLDFSRSGKYIGIQDNDPTPSQSIYAQYYHPDAPPEGRRPDMFKRDYGYPEFPGLLDASVKGFKATGVCAPWYSGNGNHDGLCQGNAPIDDTLGRFLNEVAVGNTPKLGSKMMLDTPNSTKLIDTIIMGMLMPHANFDKDPRWTILRKIYEISPQKDIPANPERRFINSKNFIEAHFENKDTVGPIGHGFTEKNIEDNTLYYRFDIAPKVMGLMLDTVNRAGGHSGSIGRKQANWLEEELQRVHNFYYDSKGDKVVTGNDNQYVILFSHHNILTMKNDSPDPSDPERLLGDEIKQLILRYPNVILYVNGHSHMNRVWHHKDERSGFWELNTASHIDFPQLSRIVELVDNQDGTLSIYGVLVDHAAPAQPDAGKYSLLDLASISREMAANEPMLKKGGAEKLYEYNKAIGNPEDRNVELLIRNPF